MSTVPNVKPSHDSTWIVRPSNFPFGPPGAELGRVTGDTRESAQQKAEDHYGRGVVVQLASRLDLQTIAQTRRLMTAGEAQMARAVACCTMLRRSQNRSAMRALHARSLTSDRSISEGEATILRACVTAFAAQLPSSIVELARAGGAT